MPRPSRRLAPCGRIGRPNPVLAFAARPIGPESGQPHPIMRMKLIPALLWRLLVLLAAGSAALPPVRAASPASGATVQADLARARQLTLSQKLTEARTLYERCIAQEPDNADARFLFGVNLYLEGDLTKDAATAAALRKQGREQLLEAKRLGSQEPLVDKLLGQLKADGSPLPPGRFSANDAVETLMQAAEDAFAKADYSRAAELHQQALRLEPGNYFAALYCGDAYLAQKDYAAAGEWFAKAVAINPDKETAYRYWADALARQKKYEAATERFIEAVVAEPYNNMTRGRFRQYAQTAGLSSRIALLSLPRAAVKLTEGKPEIQLAPDQDSYAGALALGYAAACLKVRTDEFARRYPAEKLARRSLAEEVAGLRSMLQIAQELAGGKSDPPAPADVARWKPSLATLAEIDKAGLLEAFVLLDRADGDLAIDYAAYRAAHRDELRRYLHIYWCGLD